MSGSFLLQYNSLFGIRRHFLRKPSSRIEDFRTKGAEPKNRPNVVRRKGVGVGAVLK
jgi:hypothetical protein